MDPTFPDAMAIPFNRGHMPALTLPDDAMAIPDMRGPMPVPTLPDLNDPDTCAPDRLMVYHPKLPYGPMLDFACADNGGVNYDLVYYACCIVAGNCWEDNEVSTSQDHGSRPGPTTRSASRARQNNSPTATRAQGTTTTPGRAYLSISKDPDDQSSIINVPDNGVIKGIWRVYFHVPENFRGIRHHPEFGYPITPNFENWVFPHGRLPKLWADLPPCRPYIPSRFLRCHLSRCLHSVDVARMIPTSCKDWWDMNRMDSLIPPGDPAGIDSPRNVHGLRADIHGLFDQSTLVPFPKPVGDGETQLFACVQMHPSENNPGILWDLIITFHNHLYYHVDWIPHEILFARFAWSIFCTAHMPILEKHYYAARRVFYLSTRTDSGETEQKEWDRSDPNFPCARTGHSSTPWTAKRKK
ncbi:hypothetical protein F5Y13DRAFT_204927 [Hypoxylon sp. FL1857]|nr:hypothetical protein F5Y13DRAFT_204927 [Hypoxylon sp. FL1857]